MENSSFDVVSSKKSEYTGEIIEAYDISFHIGFVVFTEKDGTVIEAIPAEYIGSITRIKE